MPDQVGPALGRLAASQPSGAINAPVDRIRYLTVGSQFRAAGREASTAGTRQWRGATVVDNAAAALFERAASAAPAKPADQGGERRSLAFGEQNLATVLQTYQWALIRR